MKDNLTRGFPARINRDEFITPFDKFFDQFFTESFPEFSKPFKTDIFSSGSYPKCDIIDFDDRVQLIAEIPGLTKEQISIDIENNLLVLKGEKTTKNESGGTFIRRELKKSSFQRTFEIDSDVLKMDEISAKFDNGVLELIIPKKEKVESTKKKVEIT